MWIHLQAQHREPNPRTKSAREIHARNLCTKMHILDVGAKSVHENAQFGGTHENAQFGYACEILEFHVENEIP